MTKKLILLVMRNVMKNPEIEYVSLLVDIVNLIIGDKDQRILILEGVLKEEDPATTLIDDEAGPFIYRRLLKQIEAQIEIRAIKPLHKKITRQLKEIDFWIAAHKKAIEKEQALQEV